MDFIKFVQDNFAHVAPILLAALIGLAITIERFRALVFSYPIRQSASFFEKIRILTLADKISEAIVLCDKNKGKPAANIVREGLLRAHQPEVMIEHGLEIALGEAQDRVKARTGFLSTIANVATLLGLFGTIVGLVQSFEAVGHASAQQRSALLAAGISTAMNATMLGLAVAIPAMVAFSFLMNRANRLNAELDRCVVRVLDILKQRHLATEAFQPGEAITAPPGLSVGQITTQSALSKAEMV